MRGRTNASNGGIFLNATTDDFEVATGNSITAGDFVEYHYDTQPKTLISGAEANATMTNNYHVSGNYYVAIINGVFSLYSFIDDDITIVATYNDVVAKCMTAKSSTLYYICDTNGTLRCLEVDVENLTITSNATVADSSARTFMGVVDDVLVVGNISNQSVSGTYSVNAKTFNISNKTSISALKSYSGSSTSGGAIFAGMVGNVVYIISGYSSNSKYRYITLTISTNDGTITYALGTDVSPLYSGDTLYSVENSVIFDRFIVWGHMGSNARLIEVFDTTTKTRVGEAISIGSSGILRGISNANSNGYFIVEIFAGGTYPTFCLLFHLDASNLNIEKVGEQLDIANTLAKVLTHGNKYCPASSAQYYNVEIVSNQLVLGEATDTVQSWSGGLNPMGVAKQSGTAGDTIEVYIPAVNS